MLLELAQLLICRIPVLSLGAECPPLREEGPVGTDEVVLEDG